MTQLSIDSLYGRALYQACRLVLVCGSRTMRREHLDLIVDELRLFPKNTVVMHGGQGTYGACGELIGGADMLANAVAAQFGLATTVHSALWTAYGRAAGPIRNREMLDKNPDLVLAFWDGRTTGTRGVLKEARRRGIPVRVVSFDP